MYHPATTTTSTNRHRVASVDGYWAPGGIPSMVAANVSLNLTQRDLSSVLPLSAYHLTSMDPLLSTNLHHHNYPMPSDPTMRSRRSHRPRGCRGGRKNRKAKMSSHDEQQPNSQPYHNSGYDCSEQYGNMNHHFGNAASLSSIPATEHAVAAKGDLSPYQHLKISPKPWNFGLRGSNDNNCVSDTAGTQLPSIKQQMLPPPVPSALFDSHRQNMEHLNQNNKNLSGSGLKMLPSFDEDELDDGQSGDACDDYYHQYYDNNDDDSSESIEFGMTIPKPPQRLGDVHHTPSRRGLTSNEKHEKYSCCSIPATQSDNCEATVDTCCTASSRSRTSSSSSDDSALATTNETNLRSISNFSMHKPHQQQQLQQSNHTSETFSLPILHLHIIPPPPSSIHKQTSASSSTNSSTQNGGFGSLFVTSPRSFLFGIGRSSRQTHVTHNK